MQEKSVKLVEWIVPTGFVLFAGWLTWHMPAFILDFAPPDNDSALGQLSALYTRRDVTPNLGGLFGGYADIVDWLSVLGVLVTFVLGMMTIRRAAMEYEGWVALDRVAVFVGRVTMILTAALTSVMLYEVVLRYVFEAPTLWANELSLWLAGFLFLCSGLYAMQQRSHIRIFLLYDVLPRTLQRVCDVISTTLIVTFAFFLIYGGYGEAFVKFFRWETFGTAFDPPIPATLKPMVLFVVAGVALQSVLNLIVDWNNEPVVHTAADDIDAEELEALKRSVGAEGVGDIDVTRGSIQSDTSRHS